MRSDVWRESAGDVGRSRHTVVHEVAHALLHAEELRLGIDLHAAGRHADELDADWQADTLAGALLCPLAALAASLEREPGDVAQRWGISEQAARVRLGLLA